MFASSQSMLLMMSATHNTFTLASRLTRQKYSRDSIGSGHVRGVVRGGQRCNIGWTNLGVTLQRALETDRSRLAFLKKSTGRLARCRCADDTFKPSCWESWHRFVRQRSRTCWNVPSKLMEAKSSLIGRHGCSPLQIAVGRDPWIFLVTCF